MVCFTASGTFLAWEGRNARSSIDNDSLTLGGGRSHPQVDVVCAVSLVEGAHLLLELTTAQRRRVVTANDVAAAVVGIAAVSRRMRPGRQGKLHLVVNLSEFTSTAC